MCSRVLKAGDDKTAPPREWRRQKKKDEKKQRKNASNGRGKKRIIEFVDQTLKPGEGGLRGRSLTPHMSRNPGGRSSRYKLKGVH